MIFANLIVQIGITYYVMEKTNIGPDNKETKNKITISKIIYNHQYCDSYEDFFKDNIQPLKIKCDGIQISLDNLNDCI